MRQRFGPEGELLGRRFVFTQPFGNARSFHFQTFADARVFPFQRLQTEWHCLKNLGQFESSPVGTAIGCLHMIAIFRSSAKAQNRCKSDPVFSLAVPATSSPTFLFLHDDNPRQFIYTNIQKLALDSSPSPFIITNYLGCFVLVGIYHEDVHTPKALWPTF